MNNFIFYKNLIHFPCFQAAVLTCDHFCTEARYDYMRVYNDADGSLLGTYHGGHCDDDSNTDQHLIVVSTSGRISVDWSSDGSITRTGFSCLFTSGTAKTCLL